MRHPSARVDGRGDLSLAPRRWLLVGNSRWHWAEACGERLNIHHHPAADGPRSLAAGPPPQAWAAVGPLGGDLPLDPLTRVVTADLPVAALPAWLGVDRGLAGWLAWRQRGCAVLVADAGTVLSLTRIDRGGGLPGGG